MKAYVCFFTGADWADFFHAQDVQEVRRIFWLEWAHCDGGEFIDIRARRVPDLDNKPLTGKNISEEQGYSDWDEVDYSSCRCQLCKSCIEENKLK
jgi:hypothetical protein